MIAGLADWVKNKWDQVTVDTANLSTAVIDQIIANHRAKSADRLWLMQDPNDRYFTVDTATTRATITLHDLDGGQIRYGHEFQYWFYPSSFEVLVNDVVQSTTAYTFYAPSMDLVFTSALAGTDPTVQVRGHLVNYNALMVECGHTLVNILGVNPNISQADFDALSRRILALTQQLYGRKLVRR